MKSESRLKAIFFIILFSLFFTGTGVCYKFAACSDVAIYDFQIFRAFFMFSCFVPVTLLSKKSPCNDLPQGKPPLLLLRICLAISNFMLYNLALTMIPLALATIIFNLAPFWTSILGYFVLGDPIYKIEFVAMAICLALVIYMTVMK